VQVVRNTNQSVITHHLVVVVAIHARATIKIIIITSVKRVAHVALAVSLAAGHDWLS